MGQAIGQILSFAVGVALSPLPIIAVVLMLATPTGRVNGPAFLSGWIGPDRREADRQCDHELYLMRRRGDAPAVRWLALRGEEGG